MVVPEVWILSYSAVMLCPLSLLTRRLSSISFNFRCRQLGLIVTPNNAVLLSIIRATVNVVTPLPRANRKPRQCLFRPSVKAPLSYGKVRVCRLTRQVVGKLAALREETAPTRVNPPLQCGVRCRARLQPGECWRRYSSVP